MKKHKIVTMVCPFCKNEYPEYEQKSTLDTTTGKTIIKRTRRTQCSCGTNLVRKVTK